MDHKTYKINCRGIETTSEFPDLPSIWPVRRIARDMIEDIMLLEYEEDHLKDWSGDSILTDMDTGKKYKISAESYTEVVVTATITDLTEIQE